MCDSELLFVAWQERALIFGQVVEGMFGSDRHRCFLVAIGGHSLPLLVLEWRDSKSLGLSLIDMCLHYF